MATTRRGSQLVLEWADGDGVRWDELPPATRKELHALLGALLRQAAGGIAQAAEAERGDE